MMVAFIWDCSAGSATLTTVPSMKARLDPRMVAASTHGCASREHGAAALPDCIEAASHGFLKMFAMSCSRRIFNYDTRCKYRVDALASPGGSGNRGQERRSSPLACRFRLWSRCFMPLTEVTAQLPRAIQLYTTVKAHG